MICIYQVIPEASQQKSGPSDQFRTYSGPLLALRSGSGPSPEFRTLVVPLNNKEKKDEDGHYLGGGLAAAGAGL